MPFRALLMGILLAAAHAAPAADLDRLAPVRWPAAPLQAGLDWYQPWSLELLRGTAFNCVLTPWSGDGTTAAADQRRVVREYAKEAQKRGIAVMALVSSAATAARSAAEAVDAPLEGLVLDGEIADPAQLAEALRRLTHDKGRELPVLVLPGKASTSPGLHLFSENGAVQATPSSEPWIDFNFWLVRRLRAREPGPVWLGYTLENPSIKDYTRAIADAAAPGGRWVVAPDNRLLTGLARQDAEALSGWRQIGDAARFFEQHASWRRFAATGPLGIVECPASEHSDLAAENQNLIARRKISYRLLERSALSGPGLAGLQAVLAVGCPLDESEKSALRAFAERGGLAIVGAAWGEAVPPGKEFDVRPLGKGRIAVYRTDDPDAEALSKDVLFWIGRGNLGIRLFHAVTVLPLVSQSGDGKQLLVQMVNYATEPAEAILVRLDGEYHAARLFCLDHPPVTLALEKAEHWTEVKVPSVPVYAALLLER